MTSRPDENVRDALAYVRCVLTNDNEGVRVLSRPHVEPDALVVHLAVPAAAAFGADNAAALAGVDAAFARLDGLGGS